MSIQAKGDLVPDNPEILLSRRETARALTAAGFPISAATLATMANRGGGPAFHRFGARRVLYRWQTALDWAKGRLSKPVRTTAEAGAGNAPDAAA